jgi:glucose-1-phosphate cytidylyltransferase
LPLGYKCDYIKNYFLNYKTINSDFEIDLGSGAINNFKSSDEDWKISLIDTGKNTLTGGRLLRLKDSLNDTFMMTYGDGVSDVDIDKLLAFHKSHGKIATVTAVRPQARFGGLKILDNKVESFIEKPDSNSSNESWINGGFFVFNKEIFDYLEDDMTILEKSPLEKLSSEGQLMSFQHNGFWQCMDTIRDKEYLNELISKGSTPWL